MLKPRSLDSFGLAGVLSAEASIYYTKCFSSRDLGRISDLVSIQFRGLGFGELHLRSILMFLFYEAYYAIPKRKEDSVEVFSEPIVLECGLDSNVLGIGTCFRLAATFDLVLEGLAERVGSGSPKDLFEKLLIGLSLCSEQVILKTKLSERKIELNVMLEPTVNREDDIRPIFLVNLDSEEDESPILVSKKCPEVKAYIELGDLNYCNLLEDENIRAQPISAPSTGDPKENTGFMERVLEERFVVRGVTEKIDPEWVRIKADDVSATSNLFNKNQKTEPDPVVGISDDPAQPVQEPIPKNEFADVGNEPIEAEGDKYSNIGLPRVMAQSVLLEVQVGGYERFLKKLQEDVFSLKREARGEKIEGITQGILNDAQVQKKRLEELAKKLNISVRRRELHFRDFEADLKRQLLAKDRFLREVNQAFTEFKENSARVEPKPIPHSSTIQSKEPSDVKTMRRKVFESQKAIETLKKEFSHLRSKYDSLSEENRRLISKNNDLSSLVAKLGSSASSTD